MTKKHRPRSQPFADIVAATEAEVAPRTGQPITPADTPFLHRTWTDPDGVHWRVRYVKANRIRKLISDPGIRVTEIERWSGKLRDLGTEDRQVVLDEIDQGLDESDDWCESIDLAELRNDAHESWVLVGRPGDPSDQLGL